MTDRNRRRRPGFDEYALAGTFRHGRKLEPSTGNVRTVRIPWGHLDPDEKLYIVESQHPRFNIRPGDILVVKRATRVASGRLVLARLGERIYLGYWWAKQGRRALMDEDLRPIVEHQELRILGTVTVTLRYRDPSQGA